MSKHKDSLDDDIQNKYLKAVDIEDIAPVDWTITSLDRVPVGIDGELKRCATFAEHEKPFPLNITAIKTLRTLYGSDPAYIVGKKVRLVVTYADYQGQSFRVIRIAQEKPVPKRKNQEEFALKSGDEIPMQ